ncbi:unnamed protein product [Ceutorhynchus assimilis]|uniref:RPAP1 C-terminal domain-containing protein n=1 Tax=Ceutorhynchus assimilis TaxID=467358 RepID=A0A9P0DBT0_9CUCU|nr:unnamed protein product [Ceutorhynchus assimilis]
MAVESSSLDEMEVLRGMLSVPKFNDFMSPDEFEAVMIPLMTDNTNNLRQNGRIENRFNSEGYLLPQCIARFNDATYRYTYHVYRLGIRPDHVGHSLQELSSLSRSDDVQRRNMALNTLANILKIDRTGVYKRVIELPIGQIFFVLKFNLDDDTPSILIAAIRALRNLVYFPIGEICLDKMACSGMGIIQPVMSIDDAMEDDDTLDDEQLAEINLTKCLIRTGTLERIRYIVNIVKPKMEIIVNCIEILIRLARDSKFVVDKILECEGLMSSLIRYFLPTMESVGLDNSCPDWYYSPLPQMIKLLRVLSARSRNIAANLLEEYDLLNTMIPYLDEGNFFQNDTNLQVECLRYWTLVLHYEFPMDAYR